MFDLAAWERRLTALEAAVGRIEACLERAEQRLIQGADRPKSGTVACPFCGR